MFEDWSVDVDQADDEPAGHVNTQPVEVPSQRHLDLYRLLRSASHLDQAGRLVCWWPQAKLAARLGVSVRTVQNLLADLREPGADPRHPRRAAGQRLGLLRVEPTHYRDQATGRHRLGGNLYVIAPGQHATRKAALTSGDADGVACLNKETPASEERRVGSSGVSSSVPVVEVGRQHPPDRLDHDPTKAEVLATLRAGVGEVEVIGPPRWQGRRPVYRPHKGSRPLPLAGDVEDLHAAVDALDQDTVPASYAAKVNGRRRRKR